MEADVEALLADAQRYSLAVEANVQHQINFAQTLENMFTPSSANHVLIGGEDATHFERDLQASRDLRQLCESLKDQLSPYLV